jgi:flavin-dependent dehydrogenase
MSQPESFDVIVIGAGPSGAISSALLVQKGLFRFNVGTRTISTIFHRRKFTAAVHGFY